MSEASEVEFRQPALSGGRNFRDLGGYPSRYGEGQLEVRWGGVYRSGHFGDLTPEGQQEFSALGISTVIDFRMPQEREKHPNRLPAEHPHRVVEIAIDPGSTIGFTETMMDPASPADSMVRVMEEMNRSLVRDHSAPFRRMFEVLCGDEDGPHVFHCAAGKDRTGTGSALLLAALGVDRETIVEDFLLTNAVLDVETEVARAVKDYGGPAAEIQLPPERLRPMFEVRASYLVAAFDEIDHELGGMEGYLRDQMGLDSARCKRLHELYLVPVR